MTHIAFADTRAIEPDPDAPDFARAIGAAGWARLAPAIRRRFAETPRPGRPIRYVGTMQRVDCSRAGWLLAQACRLLGTPFAPFGGIDVPVTITLSTRPGDTAIVWERAYRYADHPAAIVVSQKRVAADGGLLECIGAGFTMKLAVSERNGALRFESRGYFRQYRRWRIALPDLVSPGSATVLHQDLGRGRFRFTMTVRNRLLGVLFHQDGTFASEECLP